MSSVCSPLMQFAQSAQIAQKDQDVVTSHIIVTSSIVSESLVSYYPSNQQLWPEVNCFPQQVYQRSWALVFSFPLFRRPSASGTTFTRLSHRPDHLWRASRLGLSSSKPTHLHPLPPTT